MSVKQVASSALQCLRMGMASLALFQLIAGTSLNAQQTGDDNTTTPIKHVIVIIGENRSFDHVFATYEPKRGQTVWNLLSEGIVNADGTPGPNFSQAEQSAATDQAPDTFLLSPAKTAFPNTFCRRRWWVVPSDSYVPGDSLTLAQQSEIGLPSSYYQYLISGGTGLTSKTPDTRITNVNSLAAGSVSIDEWHRPLLTTPTPQVRSIASTRCGSSWIAARINAYL